MAYLRQISRRYNQGMLGTYTLAYMERPGQILRLQRGSLCQKVRHKLDTAETVS